MDTPVDLVDPAAAQTAEARDFSVFRQKVTFDIDFLKQSAKCQTEITIVPQTSNFRRIRLNCRQCDIQSITVEEKPATFTYRDPYKRLAPHLGWGIRQHHLYKERLESFVGENSAEELVIDVPRKVVARDSSSVISLGARLANGVNGPPSSASITGASELQTDFRPLAVKIDYTLKNVREGLHFIGLSENDKRYPNLYTQNTAFTGSACCLFPCVDDLTERSEWEITVKCSKTLGSALGVKDVDPALIEQNEDQRMTGTESNDWELSQAERALEMAVICSGQLDDESDDPVDNTRKSVTFSTRDMYCSANQIGFVIGPFEQVDLSDLREVDEDEKLAEDAVQVVAYCLPGRAEEVKNTALPMAKAIDFFTERFTKFSFPTYSMCFLDDLPSDTAITTGLSFISTRLLFAQDIIDPIYENTHKVVYALAAQYSGIGVTARSPADNWCIIGMAYFMTDVFMRHLCGNNEYRFRQKLAADRIFELDRSRPSLHSLGSLLQVDPSESEFVALKAAVVLFILDRRLTKSSTSSGVARIINRTLTNTKGGDAEATLLSTAQFQKTCERTGHAKLDSFFNQWIYGAGCPSFAVSQRFNKKKLVVEMTIDQVQNKPEVLAQLPSLNPDFFLRDVNEELNEIWDNPQNVFTGPMTIRIHEADGTPYEHIVDIKEAHQKLEIPYNTKYKRLRRKGKHGKERQPGPNTAVVSENTTSEDKDDVLIHCLGDVLQSEQDVKDWRLRDWDAESEMKMSDDSYEWIRMDADFEWICKMDLNQQAWMFVSQLQQDRDVVAQYESLQYMKKQNAHPLIATFLTRTIMDSRYFHGIRTYAISLLAKHAVEQFAWIGSFQLRKIFSELFCAPGTSMARANDFSDRTSYLIQCAIPRALSRVRNNAGMVPLDLKKFFVDTLKFNDNSHCEFSDSHWISLLMSCLADVLVIPPGYPPHTLSYEDQRQEEAFKKDAISEIERYRRIDEWISSYQNIFSVTALQCLLRLSKGNALHPKIADFLQYTRKGNSDQLRLQAFTCLTELGKMKNGAILQYILHTISEDPSPYMREKVFQIFGRGLGLVALGEDQPKKPVVMSEGLVIEEGSTDDRAQDAARKSTIHGAMKALKQELAQNEALQQGLWDAITSSKPPLREIWQYLTIPEILYETESRLLVSLKYPRYWKVHYEGDGKLRFTHDGRVRTEPRKPAVPPKPTLKLGKPPAPPRTSSMKLSLTRAPSISGDMNLKIDPTPTSQAPTINFSMPPPSQHKPQAAPVAEPAVKVEATPDAERKPVFTPRTKLVKLKVSKLRDPAYVAQLNAIVPRPPALPEQVPKKLKFTAAGSNIKSEPMSPPPPVMNSQSSPPPLAKSTPGGQRRLSTASSRSSNSGKRGNKRKFDEHDAENFTAANGNLSPLVQRREPKSRRTSYSASATPQPPAQYAPIESTSASSSQQFGAWDDTQYGPANGDDSAAAQFGAWDASAANAASPREINGNGMKPTFAPVGAKSPRSLVVKLKLPRHVCQGIAAAAESDNEDEPLAAAAARKGNELHGGASFGPVENGTASMYAPLSEDADQVLSSGDADGGIATTDSMNVVYPTTEGHEPHETQVSFSSHVTTQEFGTADSQDVGAKYAPIDTMDSSPPATGESISKDVDVEMDDGRVDEVSDNQGQD